MILVSGSIASLENLCAKIWHHRLDARIVCVVANHRNIEAEKVAKKWKLPYWCLDCDIYPPVLKWESVWCDLVRIYDPGLIVLAGFDRIVSVPPKYESRIIRVAPSLFPEWGNIYGNLIHQAIIKSRAKSSGCTIHLYSNNEILGQIRVPIVENETPETLKKKIESSERILLPKAIETIFNDLIPKNIY